MYIHIYTYIYIYIYIYIYENVIYVYTYIFHSKKRGEKNEGKRGREGRGGNLLATEETALAILRTLRFWWWFDDGQVMGRW
jgi:hypothetical protein